MTNTRVRAVAASAVVALLLSPLAACGSDEEKPEAAGSTASSSAKADVSASATPAGDAETPGASGEEIDAANFAELMSAAIQEQETAHVSMKMGDSLSVEGDVRYGDDGTAMKVTMGMGQQDATMIFVDDVLYMQMPGMSQPGKWTKVTKGDAALGQIVEQMDAMGPRGSLEVMKNGLQEVRLVGTEEVDGEQLKHYEVTVDAQAALESLGQLGDAAGGDVPQEVSYDLYLDDDNLMRRIVLDVAGQQMVMETSDWGKDVEIEAPPASDVVELPSGSGAS